MSGSDAEEQNLILNAVTVRDVTSLATELLSTRGTTRGDTRTQGKAHGWTGLSDMFEGLNSTRWSRSRQGKTKAKLSFGIAGHDIAESMARRDTVHPSGTARHG